MILDLGPTGRVVFSALFVTAQVGLIATAGRRPDRAYGFRMYHESATATLRVWRELDDGGMLPIDDDGWEARDCAGTLHHESWSERVRFPAPERLGVALAAPYGVDSARELARGAVAFVAAHSAGDCQTRALHAELTTVKNGRPPEVMRFVVGRAP